MKTAFLGSLLAVSLVPIALAQSPASPMAASEAGLAGVTPRPNTHTLKPAVTILQQFTQGHAKQFGESPDSPLLLGPGGTIFGTATIGAGGAGVAYQLSPPAAGQTRWTETVIANVGGFGFYPQGGLVADSAGSLYGPIAFVGHSGNGSIYKLTPPAKGQFGWTESVLNSFGVVAGDGATPSGGLIVASGGTLYGTTIFGGNLGCNITFGCGTVFKLSLPEPGQTAWTETVVYRFQPANGDGIYPQAGLVMGRDGALYGTTWAGGTSGNGTVFKLEPPLPGQTAWNESVLYSFGSPNVDGINPQASLIFDAQGALYGTTAGGGGGRGTVFKLSPPKPGQTNWTETILHAFGTQYPDGSSPQASLTLDASGALFGTTEGSSGLSGGGTVFKLTPPPAGQTSWTETLIYVRKAVQGSTSGLVADTTGALYGTFLENTLHPSNQGIVFKLTHAGFNP